jgi:hypothetical protein
MAKRPKPEKSEQRWFVWSSFVVAGALAFSMAVGLVILPMGDYMALRRKRPCWTAQRRSLQIQATDGEVSHKRAIERPRHGESCGTGHVQGTLHNHRPR